MFDFLKKKTKINSTQIVDKIEAAVYARIKPYGFKKHGRTLHRFVSGDISQVINFQTGVRGMQGFMCVNVGIRIPECAERRFYPDEELKKYYHEYECTLRSRLGQVTGKREKWYDLSKSVDRIVNDITAQLEKIVLPAFDMMKSRESILERRKDYPWLSTWGSELLDECMIYGRMGDLDRAKELFEEYYRLVVKQYNDACKKGHRVYLRTGQRAIYMGQDIIAEKDGYVTLYGANHGHIDYLDELAIRLSLR